MDVKLDSLQAVIIALTCLVPGFIIYSTYSAFTVRRNETKELLFLRFVALTALNFSICFVWIKLLLGPKFLHDHPWKTAHYLVWILFGSPIALGLLIAVIDRWQLSRIFTRLLGLRPMHSTPTAWDYCFNQMAHHGPRFVIVTFKDGKQVGGIFAHPAVASSDSSERDIYLIGVHNLVKDDDGNIKGVYRPQNDGILIIGSEIRSFEFLCPSTANETKPRIFFNRVCYVAKTTRQKIERQSAVLRQLGAIAITTRGHMRRVSDKHREFIFEVDRGLEEEKNGRRESGNT